MVEEVYALEVVALLLVQLFVVETVYQHEDVLLVGEEVVLVQVLGGELVDVVASTDVIAVEEDGLHVEGEEKILFKVDF